MKGRIYCGISSGSVLFAKVKSIFRERNIMYFGNLTCHHSLYSMEHPDLAVANFMENTFVLAHWGWWWLSGSVLDLRSRGCRFEPHQRHCVVSLSKTPYLFRTGSTQEDPFWQNWKIVDWDVKNQIKQNKTPAHKILVIIKCAQKPPSFKSPGW